jgi:Kef-type K+ transport system membrane component KefB
VTEIERTIEGLDGETRIRIREVVQRYSQKHLEELIEPIGHFLVPIFFVLTGMAVDLTTLSDPSLLVVALGITAVAFLGKIVAGAVAGPVDRWLVGWGMVPRGEVGLIFATIGRRLGVVTGEVYSVIVIMVILTTLFTPPTLTYLLKRPKVVTAEASA